MSKNMGPNYTVKIRGTQEVLMNIKRFGSQLNRSMVRALKEIGTKIESDAKRKCPRKTSRLRNSIASKVDERALVVQTGTDVEYAVFVEFGTGIYAGRGPITPKSGQFMVFSADGEMVFATRVSGQRPQPFLGPAFEENRKEVGRIIEKYIGEACRVISVGI